METIAEAPVEEVPVVAEIVEAPVVEEAVVEAAPVIEEVAEAAQPVEEAMPVEAAPLNSFEVTEHAPSEITLEKVMEQVIEAQLIQPVAVEEGHISVHPLEAPQVAHSEVDTADHTQTPQADESEESTATE